MDPENILALIIVALGTVAWFMIRHWAKTWETRLAAVDDRLDEHDDRHADHNVTHATLEANLKNIATITDETRTDVKELLRNSNGNRSTG